MQYKLVILTTWTGDGLSTETANRPMLGDTYALQSMSDITGQPSANLHPDPNQYVVEAVADEATYLLIDADADYFVISVDEIEEAVL